MLLSPHPFLQDLQQLTLLCPHLSQVLFFSWSSSSLLRIPSQDDPSFAQLLWIAHLNQTHVMTHVISSVLHHFLGCNFRCTLLITAPLLHNNIMAISQVRIEVQSSSSWSAYLPDILQKANQLSYKTHWWSPNLERCAKTSLKFLCIQSSTKSVLKIICSMFCKLRSVDDWALQTSWSLVLTTMILFVDHWSKSNIALLHLGFIFIIIIIIPPADSLVQILPLFHLNGNSCKYSWSISCKDLTRM